MTKDELIRMIAAMAVSDEPDAPFSEPGEDAREVLDQVIGMARSIRTDKRDPDAAIRDIDRILAGLDQMTSVQIAAIADTASAVSRAAHMKLWQLPANQRKAAYYESRTGQPFTPDNPGYLSDGL
jgi:hypothetical protein